MDEEKLKLGEYVQQIIAAAKLEHGAEELVTGLVREYAEKAYEAGRRSLAAEVARLVKT